MNKKDYNKLYNEMVNAIVSFCEKNKVNYEVEMPQYDFSTKRYNLKNIPNVGNMTIAVEPYECARGKQRGVDILSVFMRFETYNNPNGIFDIWRFNEFSFKYNIHLDAKNSDGFLLMFMRDMKRLDDLANKTA